MPFLCMHYRALCFIELQDFGYGKGCQWKANSFNRKLRLTDFSSSVCSFIYLIILNPHLRIFSLILEREERGERERPMDRHMGVREKHHAEIAPTTWVCALIRDWTWNLLVCGDVALTNWATWPGWDSQSLDVVPVSYRLFRADLKLIFSVNAESLLLVEFFLNVIMLVAS